MKQTIRNHTVETFRNNRTGIRYAVVRGIQIPAEMCSLAAGKDAWMRDITFACNQCTERTPARDLECGLCPDCYAAAEQENAD